MFGNSKDRTMCIFFYGLFVSKGYLQREIGQNSSCSVCHHNTEDILHVLKDYSAVKEIWMNFVLKSCQPQFFSRNFLDWVGTNLENLKWVPAIDVFWATL